MNPIFDCFGDEGDEEFIEKVTPRESTCGVLAFHRHTERALLAHVHNSCNAAPKVQEILSAVDAFCTQRHWMMHIGPKKGKILSQILHEEIERFIQRQNQLGDTNNTFTCVELGTYCAYSSILIGDILQQYAFSHPNINFHLTTFEIQPEFLEISRAMIRLANLEDMITLNQVNVNIDGSLDDFVRDIKANINFLFMDHDKDKYLSDLMRLEVNNLIKGGTCVVADNVLFAQILDYLEYVKSLHHKHIVHTVTLESTVEYAETIDGLGKILFAQEVIFMRISYANFELENGQDISKTLKFPYCEIIKPLV